MFRLVSPVPLITVLLHLEAVLAAVDAGLYTARSVQTTCDAINGSISDSSTLIYRSQIQTYTADENTEHWFQSSNQVPTCVVEVGSPEDVSAVVQIVGAHRAPFAVYSGGHASNPGFSSTTGIHISLNRLRQVILSPDNSTVEIGFGMTWSEVFEQLEGTGYNLVGGRTVGPGVGGFTLGGGYSWKTNQHGLTVDTIKRFNLVLPNGTITHASSTENQDLFFALKGGLNRFGIVTSAEFYTHAQSALIYGGFAIYPLTSTAAVLNATTEFHGRTTDPRTQIITTTIGSALGTSTLVLFFHDAPERPPIFDLFSQIPSLLSTVKTQPFAMFVKGFPSEVVRITNVRGAFATISTSALTPRFVSAIRDETDSFGNIMALHSGTTIHYDIEPFMAYGHHATDSAYPHRHSPIPLNLFFAWGLESEDEFWFSQMRASLNRLRDVALQEAIYSQDFTQYPNYALANTTAEELYGPHNAARLRGIRDLVDPARIMDLAGGFHI